MSEERPDAYVRQDEPEAQTTEHRAADGELCEEFISLWSEDSNYTNLLDNRDYLSWLLDFSFDLDAQLDAARSMLTINQSAAKQVQANIKLLNERATHTGSGHDIDELICALERSSYSDAVDSLVATVVIVPMMESFFIELFQGIGKKYKEKKIEPPEHHRWRRADNWNKDPNNCKKDRWDCSVYFGKNKPQPNLYEGIRQLSQATGLCDYLEEEKKNTMDWIKALLVYRNYVFHNGLEWSEAKGNQFQELSKKKNWQYFKPRLTGETPRMFYLCDTVINEMPQMIEFIFDKAGIFAKNLASR